MDSSDLIFYFDFAHLLVDTVAEPAPTPRHAAIVEREYDVAVLSHELGEVVAPAAHGDLSVRSAVVGVEHGILLRWVEMCRLIDAVIQRLPVRRGNAAEIRCDVRVAIRPVRM